MLVRAPRLGRSGESHGGAAEDWLGDAIVVARRESRWFGPFMTHVTSVIAWCDRTVIARLRRHPILGVALASLAFGIGVGLNQGIREGYFPASTLLTVGLLTCGMFDFLMLAGSYLGVVHSGAKLAGGLSEQMQIPPKTASSPGFSVSQSRSRSLPGSPSSPSWARTPRAREPDRHNFFQNAPGPNTGPGSAGSRA
jgi:hypothetical protein